MNYFKYKILCPCQNMNTYDLKSFYNLNIHCFKGSKWIGAGGLISHCTVMVHHISSYTLA